MGNRQRQHYLGDLGEAEVYTELLHLGASINYLTQSDSGWDLHLHLPSEPIDVASSPPIKSWTLSGRVAHVQVKKKTSRAAPKLDLETARGWVTGTRSGVPTFLFIVDEEGNLEYATPKSLSEWIGQVSTRPERKMGTEKLQTYVYTRPKFGRVLHLWSRYPNALLALSKLDSALHARGDTDCADIFEIVADVAVGWLTFAGLTYPDEGAQDWERAVRAFCGTVDELGLSEGRAREGALRRAIEQSQNYDNNPGLPVATYSLQPNAQNCLDDSLQMLNMAFKVISMDL
jgi:hypothetical protein